jgi:hypothetical protein
MEERGGSRVGFRRFEKKGEQMRGQRGKRDAVPAVAKRTGGTVGASLSHLRRCCRPPQPLLPPPSSNLPRVPPSSLPLTRSETLRPAAQRPRHAEGNNARRRGHLLTGLLAILFLCISFSLAGAWEREEGVGPAYWRTRPWLYW